MRATWWLGVVAVGCGFDHGTGPGATGDAARDVPVDIAIDVLPSTCNPGELACDGRTLRTCGAGHTWDPGLDHTCDFTCSAGACVATSNIPTPSVAACDASAPRLAPAPGATITFTDSFGTHIDCFPDCGDLGVTRIDPVPSASSSLVWFCLSRLSLSAGSTLGFPDTGGPASAIALVVDGAASIDGTIAFDGGDATRSLFGGVGAPGGFVGADLGDGAGHTGAGPCGGGGGQNVGSGSHWVGGGGGGAGYATSGGNGGNGECSQANHFANGHAGASTCGSDNLIPLVGGSGGGGGGDATTNVAQGWPGGGGGGAIQISSRVSVAIGGSIHARGGHGYGEQSIDGGGGGGAGGAILLEAPTISITGNVDVSGGAGGSSGSGPGGAGGTGDNAAASGPSYSGAGQGGGGGGGAAGRIRINAANAACPPASSCTSGPLAPS